MPLQTSDGLKPGDLGTFKGYMVPPHMLDADETFNIRLDTPRLSEHVRSIADSIKASGFRRDKPLLIRQVEGRSIVVDGHCRLSAIRIAMNEGLEIDAIPCIAEPKGTNDGDRVLTLITANAGLSPEPLEQAEAIKRLVALGWDEPKIAAKCGRSRSWVSGLLALAGAPEELRKAVVEKVVSPSEATKMARKGPKAAVAELAQAKGRLAPGKTRLTAKTLRPATPPRTTLETATNAFLTAWDGWCQDDGARPRNVPDDVAAAVERLRGLTE